MNFYEGLFILPQTLYREDKERALELVKECTEKFGCQIDYLDLWEEKALAYQIDHVRDVAYILCYFSADSEAVQKIERAINLSDDILRCLLLRPDKSFDFEKFKTEAAEKATKKASAPVEEASAEEESTSTEETKKEETPVEEVNA